MLPGPAADEADDPVIVDRVLSTAETFFLSLKERHYPSAWRLMTEKSKDTIINDVYKTYKDMGGDTTREMIRDNFNKGGMIFVNYWNSFLRTFNPDMILDHSRWQIGYIMKDKAELTITYEKSERPVRLKMQQEKGDWKVGLVETFWSRKL